MICYYNIMDENYWIEDETGLVVGIGKTIAEAVESAEALNCDCSDLIIEDEF